MNSGSREKIIGAAVYEFAKKGYDPVTTRDICARADINISAIYYYFKNKRGLYEEVLRYVVDVINSYLGDVIKEYDEFKKYTPVASECRKMLKQIIHKFIEGICLPKVSKEIVTIYLMEYVKPSECFHIFEENLNKVYMPIISDLLMEANEGKMTEENATLSTFMLFSQIFNVAVRKDSISKMMGWSNYSEKEIKKICEVIDNSFIL